MDSLRAAKVNGKTNNQEKLVQELLLVKLRANICSSLLTESQRQRFFAIYEASPVRRSLGPLL